MQTATMATETANWLPVMAGQAGSNIIAFCAALFSVGVAVLVYVRTESRERRIEKSSAYLQLEVHSSEAFKYQAENAHRMSPLREAARPATLPRPDHEAWETALNYYFQCLNLFEVCSNFRRHRIIQKQVFASWVAWFYDILNGWHFREIWTSELRTNYTRDVRNIFDVGVEIFELHPDDETRKREFYRAVAHLMGGCDVVENWPDEMKAAPVWPPAPRGVFDWSPKVEYRALPQFSIRRQPRVEEDEPDITLSWNGPEDARQAAALAGRIVSLSEDYISHGEIQTGLSADGTTWVSNLAELYAEDFADLDGRDLVVARAADGVLVAFAVVAWEQSRRRSFAVLEDMAVDPDARSGGIGARIVDAIAERVRSRGVEWLFLESGVRNTRAHQFYQRHGFTEISHVFGRRLAA